MGNKLTKNFFENFDYKCPIFGLFGEVVWVSKFWQLKWSPTVYGLFLFLLDCLAPSDILDPCYVTVWSKCMWNTPLSHHTHVYFGENKHRITEPACSSENMAAITWRLFASWLANKPLMFMCRVMTRKPGNSLAREYMDSSIRSLCVLLIFLCLAGERCGLFDNKQPRRAEEASNVTMDDSINPEDGEYCHFWWD